MESYGAITQHLWFGDGYVLVGFRSGQVVVVSSLRCALVPVGRTWDAKMMTLHYLVSTHKPVC